MSDLKCDACGATFEDDDGDGEYDLDDHLMESCPNRDYLWVKGIAAGAESMDDLVERFTGFAAHLQERQAAGWVLKSEDNGLINLVLSAPVAVG